MQSNSILTLLLLLCFVTVSAAVYAEDEVLSDDEAYSRAYTACSQEVSPFWMPGDGEPPPKKTTSQRLREQKTIAKCMNNKNVPVKFDREAGIVRTGSNFGQNVHITIDEMFPESVLDPKTISRTKAAMAQNLENISDAETQASEENLKKYAKQILEKNEVSAADLGISAEDEQEFKDTSEKQKTAILPDKNVTSASEPNKNTTKTIKPIFLGR